MPRISHLVLRCLNRLPVNLIRPPSIIPDRINNTLQVERLRYAVRLAYSSNLNQAPPSSTETKTSACSSIS
jgi:hypothetical protein